MAIRGEDRRVRRTRSRLKAALLEMLAERDYDAITVEDIVRRADVGRSTFYTHYDSKEELLFAGFDAWMLSLATRESAGPVEVRGEGEGPTPFRFSLPLLRHVRSQERLFRAVVVRSSSPRVRRRLISLLAATALREIDRSAPDLEPSSSGSARPLLGPPGHGLRHAHGGERKWRPGEGGSTDPAREAWAHTVAWAFLGVVSWWLDAGAKWSPEEVDAVFQRATGRTGSSSAASVPLGLERGRVRLVPWQPAWSRLFREEMERIRAIAGDRVHAIEHIGSTAIPGMPAKPILDVMAAVESHQAGLALVPALARLGYEHRPDPDIPERVFLRKRLPRGARTHHLSLAGPTSRFYRVQLCFRDHLLRHPEVAIAYAALKGTLAEDHPMDREAYTAGKTAFVVGVLEQAGCE